MNIVYNKDMKNTKKSRRGWIMIATEHCNFHVAQQNPVKQNFQTLYWFSNESKNMLQPLTVGY